MRPVVRLSVIARKTGECFTCAHNAGCEHKDIFMLMVKDADSIVLCPQHRNCGICIDSPVPRLAVIKDGKVKAWWNC